MQLGTKHVCLAICKKMQRAQQIHQPAVICGCSANDNPALVACSGLEMCKYLSWLPTWSALFLKDSPGKRTRRLPPARQHSLSCLTLSSAPWCARGKPINADKCCTCKRACAPGYLEQLQSHCPLRNAQRAAGCLGFLALLDSLDLSPQHRQRPARRRNVKIHAKLHASPARDIQGHHMTSCDFV